MCIVHGHSNRWYTVAVPPLTNRMCVVYVGTMHDCVWCMWGLCVVSEMCSIEISREQGSSYTGVSAM